MRGREESRPWKEGFVPAWRPPAILLTALLAFIGCREDQGITPAVPSAPFEGITSTDASGNVISIDSADWQPLSIVGATVSPAFPNPCSTTFSLFFRMIASDSIYVTLNPSSATVWETVVTGRYGPGQYQVIGHVETLPSAVYRVYFHVIRPGGIYTTYGDVQVSR